jgi:hypothetical protein
MFKKLALLLLFILTACSLIDPYIPGLPALPPTIVVPSLTPTETVAPSVTPTQTATPEITLTPTAGAATTVTPPPVTSTPKVPTSTMTITPGAASYRVQPGTPVLTQNFAHTTQGCQWLSVAGQVFDAAGNPVLNVVVRVSGTLNGQPVDNISMTGAVTEYGPSGYEVKLGDQAVASTGTLTIQLLDLQAHPISNPLPFNTSSDCAQNVTIINFTP